MSDNDYNASDVIKAYRRRRDRMLPMILGGLAVVLVVVAAFLIILAVTGGQSNILAGIFASKTPTPTITNTPPPPTETGTITNTPEPSGTPTPEYPITYVVQSGDTLFSIAESFGVDLYLLMVWNGLSDQDQLQINQEILIPDPNSELPTPTELPSTLLPGQQIEYQVQPGDTLEIIASLFNSTAEAIAEANDIENPNNINIGQILLIPVNIATPTPSFTPNPNAVTGTPTDTSSP
jgi:LysM repeat protein